MHNTLLGRGLPSNIDAEQLVLGAVLLDETSFTDVDTILVPGDFSIEAHRRIYTAMQTIRGKGERIDRVTVANHLIEKAQLDSVGGIAYIITLDDGLPQIYNLDSYVRIVREKANKRRLIGLAQSVLSKALADDDELVGNIIGSFQFDMDSLTKETGQRSGQTLAEYIDTYPGGVQALLDGSKRQQGISMGFPELDRLTGGLYPGEFFTIGGRPGTGKSSFALCLARNIAETTKKRVIYFSPEMTKTPIFDKLLCNRSGLGMHVLRSPTMDAVVRDALQLSVTELYDTNLVIDDATGINAAYIQRSIAAHAKDGPVAAVFVDYIQLMSANSPYRFKSEYERATAVANDVLALSKRSGIPFIVLSQLRRADKATESKPPNMADLKDTSALEQHSWVVSLLHRAKRGGRTSASNKAELIIDKNRLGEVATVHFSFDGSTSTFAERPWDDDD